MTQSHFNDAGKSPRTGMDTEALALHIRFKMMLIPAILSQHLRHADKAEIYFTDETHRGQKNTVLHVRVRARHNDEYVVYTADFVSPQPFGGAEGGPYLPSAKIRGTTQGLDIFAYGNSVPAIASLARFIDHDIASSKSFAAANGYRAWDPPSFKTR